MTLTTLSNKEFFSLYKWALKRNRSVTIILSIFLAICGPVLDLYILATNYMYGVSDSEEICSMTFVIYGVIVALFGLISAVKTFSFLHNKRSVDMYGSLPSNRTTLFISHLCAGITSVGLPYLIGSITILAITAHSSTTFMLGLASILSTILMIIASYIFTALMAYCCGTVVDTIIATLAINGIWISAVTMVFGFMSELIPGASFSSIESTPILTAFAPYGFGLMGIYSYYEDEMFYASTLIWNVIFIVGFFFLTLFIANKRKSESSQNGFAVKWLPTVIKAGVSVVAGALFGYIFAASSSSGFGNMGVYAFWYVIISFVAFAVLHVIFARGKGKILQETIVYIGTTIASIGLIIAMCFGLGIDTYVPNPDSVKSVTIGDHELSDPENIRLATEIHQTIADGIRVANNYPYYFGNSIHDRYEYYAYEDSTENAELTYEDYVAMYPYVEGFNFATTYNNKFGFDTVRDYYMYPYMANDGDFDIAKINELVKQLVSSEEYKKLNCEYLFDEASREGKLAAATYTSYVTSEIAEDTTDYYSSTSSSYDYVSIGSANLDTSDTFMNGLYEALKKDILADDEFICSGYSSYDIYTNILGNSYSMLEIVSTIYENDGSYYDDYIYFCIKDSYTNTHDYLNKHGVKLSTQVNINDYTDVSSTYYGDFFSFINTGNYYFLQNLVSNSCYDWATIICNNYEIDFEEWESEHYTAYEEALLSKSLELYNNMQGENGYGDGTANYSGNYYYAYYIPDETEAEAMINEIMAYATEYITKSAGVSSDTDKANSDTDESSTDTDSNSTDSDKKESSNTSSNGSNNENSSSSSNASKTESTVEKTL